LAVAFPGLAPSDRTAVQDLRRDTLVTRIGSVERTIDDEFVLAEEISSILVYTGPKPMLVRTGDSVRVSGTVNDDDVMLELGATEITLQDGTVRAARPLRLRAIRNGPRLRILPRPALGQHRASS
jgi:hypothetical protein